MAAVISFVFYKISDNRSIQTEEPITAFASSNPVNLKIAVLPFEALDGGDTKFSTILTQRLEENREKDSLSIRILESENEEQLPNSDEEARN